MGILFVGFEVQSTGVAGEAGGWRPGEEVEKGKVVVFKRASNGY
jgi:hypothetical protein